MKYANISFKNKLVILGSLTILVIVAVFMAGAIPERGAYHDFADKRSFLGTPNFLNVVSNLPFVMIGLLGLLKVASSNASWPVSYIYGSMFIGILLTGLGSAWYHLNPNNNTLVFDRLPMTLVFMSLLSATLSEFVYLKLGGYLLAPLLIIGMTSVLWWHYTELQGAGDLRVYVLVQYYPMLLIPLILFLFPPATGITGTAQLARVVAWYFLAKGFDLFDRILYSFTGFVSGHTLKHFAAAIATFYLIRLFQTKYLSYATA